MPAPRTARFAPAALLLIAVLLAATGPRARADGFPTGRHVYLSAGHGWYYNGAYDAWMAPPGAYTVALFQGDYRRHVTNQRVSPISIAAGEGFTDEFTGGALNSANWILAGAAGGQPAVASGRLGIAYSGSGWHAGSDLITAQPFDGQMSVSNDGPVVLLRSQGDLAGQ